MSEDSAIQVNFGKAVPIFPLDSVTLLPQQVLPLHVFEPRYKQMVEHALDGSGQIAMAVFDGDQWKQNYHGRPPLRPAVCVGQIVQHEKLADGRYNLLLQGICRARIVDELPADGTRLYRSAMLEPIGLDPTTQVVIEADEDDETDEATPDLGLGDAGFANPITGPLDEHSSEALSKIRDQITGLLSTGPLTQMAAAGPVLEYVRNEEIPVPALLELVSFTLISEPALRYALLAEPSVENRAGLILRELDHLSWLIKRAAIQRPQDWPKGVSWN